MKDPTRPVEIECSYCNLKHVGELNLMTKIAVVKCPKQPSGVYTIDWIGKK